MIMMLVVINVRVAFEIVLTRAMHERLRNESFVIKRCTCKFTGTLHVPTSWPGAVVRPRI